MATGLPFYPVCCSGDDALEFRVFEKAVGKEDMTIFPALLWDRHQFRRWPIRCAPILEGLSPIPSGAAVSADLGLIFIQSAPNES
jgi:hypothetical protein